MTSSLHFNRLDAFLSALPVFEQKYGECTHLLNDVTEEPSALKLEAIATHWAALSNLHEIILEGKQQKMGFSPEITRRIILAEVRFATFSKMTDKIFLKNTGFNLMDYQEQMRLFPQTTEDQVEEVFISIIPPEPTPTRVVRTKFCYCIVL